MSVAHPALALLPADHFLLTALLLNLTLLLQWALVQRARETQPLRSPVVTELPNSSWLEPFSRELAIRKMRTGSAPKRMRRPVRATPRPPARDIARSEPVIVREQLLL